MAIAFGIFFGVTAVFIYAWWKRAQVNARGGCPVCSTEMPMYRKPASRREMLWGGWTCENCGTELDRHGIEVAQAR